jgi:hypothetical protein
MYSGTTILPNQKEWHVLRQALLCVCVFGFMIDGIIINFASGKTSFYLYYTYVWSCDEFAISCILRLVASYWTRVNVFAGAGLNTCYMYFMFGFNHIKLILTVSLNLTESTKN